MALAHPASRTGSPAGTIPAKPDRPDTPANGKPDRANGGSTDEKKGKPDTGADHPTGQSDGARSKTGKAAAGD